MKKSKNSQESEIFFKHSPDYYNPRLTIMGEWCPQINTLYLYYARCSVKDQFSKKKGREICIEKHITRLPAMSINMEYCTRKMFCLIADEVSEVFFSFYDSISGKKQ